MHACSFIFKDLALPIWEVRDYEFIKFSKLKYIHWRQSALNSAGAQRGIYGNFHPKNLHMQLK